MQVKRLVCGYGCELTSVCRASELVLVAGGTRVENTATGAAALVPPCSVREKLDKPACFLRTPIGDGTLFYGGQSLFSGCAIPWPFRGLSTAQNPAPRELLRY